MKLTLTFFTGNNSQSENLNWGSHVNKSFMEIAEALHINDKILLETDLFVYNPYPHKTDKGEYMYMFPFGFCLNFVHYNPVKDFHISLKNSNNFSFNDIMVFITDPQMLSYSSIDQQSHHGTKIFGLKRGRETLYDIDVIIKDRDNPTERDSCSQSSYYDCVDNETYAIFSKVIKTKIP